MEQKGGEIINASSVHLSKQKQKISQWNFIEFVELVRILNCNVYKPKVLLSFVKSPIHREYKSLGVICKCKYQVMDPGLPGFLFHINSIWSYTSSETNLLHSWVKTNNLPKHKTQIKKKSVLERLAIPRICDCCIEESLQGREHECREPQGKSVLRL